MLLIPAGMLPWAFGLTGNWSLTTAVLLGLVMLRPALLLFRSHDRADARKLMFASFIYLPLLQLAYVLDRLY
ncbi:MAG: hypothetical protein IPL52_13755 [Flavobacteriales bacterium]|nr:hypothetical protein [Flavobacteriales bacterium]